MDSDVYAHRVLMLQAATSYELNDMPTCKSLVDQMLHDEPETIVNAACILYRCAYSQGDVAADGWVIDGRLMGD